MTIMVEPIFDLVMAVIEIVILLYFVRDFRFRFSPEWIQRLVLFLVLFFGLCTLAYLTGNMYVKYILLDVVITVILNVFYQEKLAKVFLFVTVYSVIAYASLLIVESIFKTASLALPGTAYMYTEFTYTLIARFLEFLILFAFRKILRGIVIQRGNVRGLKLVYMQVVISGVYFIMISTSLYHTKTISAEYAGLILGFSLFALFSVLFGVIYTEHYLQMILKNRDNEAALKIKQQQCEIYENQIEDHRQIRRLYHDMKNHLLILERSKTEQFSNYCESLENSLNQYQMEFQTGNPYLDILLRDKSRICAQNDIQLKVAVNLVNVNVLEPIEVCIVCGNLLDNAIEANLHVTESKRFIEFQAHCQKTNYVIKIANAYQKEPLLSGGRILSLKDDKKAHGYGIENVRDVVSKKNGYYTVKKDKGVYVTYIILPL